MRRSLLALATGVLLLFTAGVGTATASPPVSQSSGQLAGSEQGAGAAAGSAQQEPSNTSGPIRVLSPGDDGSVSQTNEASSNATAANSNGTSQSADQAGGSGDQVVGQSAKNDQDAFALGSTLQQGASNQNEPIRVLSPGDRGDVEQTNAASSDATAANANTAEQSADQTQAGSPCCGDGGSQIVGQAADSEQDAAAISATEQEKPSNTNVDIRVLSPGDDGDVSQANTASSDATAVNANETKQSADQTQAGGSGDQVVGQSADNDQHAAAISATKQEKPSNTNVSIRVLSPGKGGSVSQTNDASSNATAANANATEQSAEQEQGGSSCRCGGNGGTQLIGQSADNDQHAAAISATKQEKPSNTNVGIRVLSPGDDGDVSQANTASSDATAVNANETKQSTDQTQAGGSCKCGSSGTQVIGQSASNTQGAFALGLTLQDGASNENSAIRVLSPGDDGSVSQSNVASSDATVVNANATEQSAEQAQGGSSCGCGSRGTQVIGQSAASHQGAAALAATLQLEPKNSNDPVRVLSYGDSGDVSQENAASSDATAGNLNGTKQSAEQDQAGGSGWQVIGQGSKNGQSAAAAALTAQLGASNENAPVRVLSPGDGGSVSQANNASSNAVAANANWTEQKAAQLQGGTDSKSKLGCCAAGIQVIGQSSQNWQNAEALALTLQLGSREPCRCGDNPGFGNKNEPTRVLSRGNDGDVRQDNTASSDAAAVNLNWTKQHAGQIQPLPLACGCGKGDGIQVIGQQSRSGQGAGSFAATLQLDGLNRSAPERKKSPGRFGGLSQSDAKGMDDAAGSYASTEQSRNQVER